MGEELSYNPDAGAEKSDEMKEEEFVQEVQAAAERMEISPDNMADILKKIAENSRGSETWQTREQDN